MKRASVSIRMFVVSLVFSLVSAACTTTQEARPLSKNAALSGELTSPDEIASVPYRIDYNGWFTVSVFVNGAGPYDFIIDTGSTQSLVFENLNAIHQFPPTGGSLQTVLGLASAGSFPPHMVDSLSLDGANGALQFNDLETVILPDWRVNSRAPYGVLGLDFLTQFFVEFDAKTQMVRFYRPHSNPVSVKGWDSIDLVADDFNRTPKPIYTITGYINRRPVRFFVDLGASGTIINRSAVANVTRAGVTVRIRPSGGDARERITDALNKSTDALATRVRYFRAGNVRWYRRIFVVDEPAIFDEIGQSNKPFGLFGADLVRDRSFAFDFAGGRFLVGPKARN